MAENLRFQRKGANFELFTNYLNLVGYGGHAPALGNEEHELETGEINIRNPEAILSTSQEFDSFIREIYQNLDNPNMDQISNTTILVPTNSGVGEIKQRV